LRDQIIAAIRDVRPDVVMTCDPWLRHEAHQDHVRTGFATLEAVLLSSLPRHRAPGEPHGIDAVVLCYPDNPNVMIDTSAEQSDRHAALDCYRAQFDDAGLAALHEALDRHERAQAREGMTHAEAFRVMSPSDLHCAVRPPRRSDRSEARG
jgi:LmbE family N-acetylglucosaminyl deacetylase